MYAVVDIETTGSRFGEDRITEVAIFQHDGEKVTGEWSSLINPGTEIPNFITSLTGIDGDMVEGAPAFEDVAGDILEWTKDRVFVAHNAAFDYHFLRRAMERIGQDFHRKRLCTVKVSRKIFPGLPAYGLGKLCRRLGIPISDRHRAFGDARATAELLSMLVENDHKQIIAQSLKHGSGERNLPPNLDKSSFLLLPEKAGVYYFRDDKGQVIYVGKARNIRRRVGGHFSAAESKGRSARMRHHIYDVSCQVTGSELIALLLESIEIKRHNPVFNRAQKQWTANYGLIQYEDQNGYSRLGVVKSNGKRPLLLTFPDMLSARSYLWRKIHDFGLCARLCGLQTAPGPCLDFQSAKSKGRLGTRKEKQAKRCEGACCQEQEIRDYNQRVANALEASRDEFGNILIIGIGREPGEKSVIGLENGHYLGYGFFQPDMIGEDPAQIRDCIRTQPDNPDVQRILYSYLRSNHKDRVLEFA